VQSDSLHPIEQIKKAFHADDSDKVHLLLERYPEIKALINEPIGPFDTPAIVAVRSRAMLDVLLDAGADLNAKSKWWAGGFGLLHGGDPDLCAYAIQRGAIVDVHAAARLGMFERLKDLVSSDPGLVHARGGDGQTPLHFSSTTEIAAYLLDHGAEIDALDVDHESTPAQYMIADRQQIVRYLIGRGCKTDILMASAVGDLNLVRQKLDANPECIRMCVSDEYFPMINRRAGGTIYQWTLGWYVSAHHVSRRFGHPDVLQLLLDRSPPVVKLIDACWSANESAVRAIRDEYPNIVEELTDSDHRQPAHAARNNQTSAVRLLLECGLPVDATSQHCATPLHWAAFHGNVEMTNTILRFGPPLDATDADFGGTPLGWAIYGSEHGWHCQTGDYAGVAAALLDAGSPRPAVIGGSPLVQDVLRGKS
jgi:ankyrin repeat protein